MSDDAPKGYTPAQPVVIRKEASSWVMAHQLVAVSSSFYLQQENPYVPRPSRPQAFYSFYEPPMDTTTYCVACKCPTTWHDEIVGCSKNGLARCLCSMRKPDFAA